VEYPVRLPPSNNWRLTAFAAAAFAALELVVLVVIALAAFGLPFAEERKAHAAAAAAARSTPARSDQGTAQSSGDGAGIPPATQPRSETSVVVLNGNGITGAADVASVDVRSRHYVLTGTGNAPHSDVPRSIVMYRRGFEGEAHRLAKDLGVRRVAPLDGVRASDLMGAQLALIIGRK
jgi:hypothetical protein